MVRQNWGMWIGENGFTASECDEIIKQSEAYPAQEAGIFSDNQVSDYRVSTIRWMNEYSFVNKLWPFIDHASQVFGIDVHRLDSNSNPSDLFPNIQYTEYHGSVDGKYNMHHDVDWNKNDGSDRKISIVVQLSDPNDYTGGDFQFNEVESPQPELLKQKGSVLVFPSYLQHSVSPVTSGVRRTLVSWFEGPKWR